MCPTKEELTEEVRWLDYFVAKNGEGFSTLWRDNQDFPEFPVAISADPDVVRFARQVMDDAKIYQEALGGVLRSVMRG